MISLVNLGPADIACPKLDSLAICIQFFLAEATTSIQLGILISLIYDSYLEGNVLSVKV